jgi:hypothetical protein
VAAAADKGIELDLEQGREIVYGMPYAEWKRRYQLEATPDQVAAFRSSQRPTGMPDA